MKIVLCVSQRDTSEGARWKAFCARNSRHLRSVQRSLCCWRWQHRTAIVVSAMSKAKETMQNFKCRHGGHTSFESVKAFTQLKSFTTLGEARAHTVSAYCVNCLPLQTGPLMIGKHLGEFSVREVNISRTLTQHLYSTLQLTQINTIQADVVSEQTF